MVLTQKTTHDTEALARLVEQFREKTNLAAVVDAYTDQTQDDETMFWQLFTERALSSAVGSQLDGIGTIVGESRDGRSDADYLLGITAQIRLNTMSGTADEILTIIALLSANTPALSEFFPASIVVVMADALDVDADQLANNLSKAAGVRATLEYTLYADANTFTFADADVDQASTTQGFTDTTVVAVGESDGVDAYMIDSDDGVAWAEIANAKAKNLWACAASSEKAIAVGNYDGGDSYILGNDGSGWSEEINTGDVTLYGVCWSEALSLFCAVGNVSGGDRMILTSSGDGSWTRQDIGAFGYRLYGVAWSSEIGLFCAVGTSDGVDAFMLTSPDGETWTQRANPGNYYLRGITAADDRFVAVGQATGVQAYIITSTDGISWTARANPRNVEFYGVAYSPTLDRVCAVGADSGGNVYIATSDDTGDTWTDRSFALAYTLAAVAWVSDIDAFVAVGEDGAGAAQVHTSNDGITWTSQTNPKDFHLRGVTPFNPHGGYMADAILIP